MGDNRLSKKDLEIMLDEADNDHGGLIKWEGDNILLKYFYNLNYFFILRVQYKYLYQRTNI